MIKSVHNEIGLESAVRRPCAKEVIGVCSLFLHLGGMIHCKITDNKRRYSSDLPQGGLEICFSRRHEVNNAILNE